MSNLHCYYFFYGQALFQKVFSYNTVQMLDEASAHLLNNHLLNDSPEYIMQRQLSDILNKFEEYLFLECDEDVGTIENIINDTKKCLGGLDQINDIEELLPSVQKFIKAESLLDADSSIKLFTKFLNVHFTDGTVNISQITSDNYSNGDNASYTLSNNISQANNISEKSASTEHIKSLPNEEELNSAKALHSTESVHNRGAIHNTSELQNIKELHSFIQMLKIEKNLSNNSIEAYIRDIKQFLIFKEFINEMNVHNAAQMYLEKLQSEQVETSSILRKFSAIKQFYKFQDLYLNMRLPKANKPLKIVDYKQILQLLDYVDNKRDKAFIYLLFATGARISEIVNLKLEQIEYCLKKRTGHFNLMGKGEKERVVFLTADGMDALNEYLSTRNDDSKYVFINSRKIADKDSDINAVNSGHLMSKKSVDKVNKTGQLDRSVDRIVDRPLTRQWAFKMIDGLCKKANVPHLHPHDFRHAQAMLLLDAGTDLVSIQNILGHKHLSTTEKYLQLHWGHLVENVKLLDRREKSVS